MLSLHMQDNTTLKSKDDLTKKQKLKDEKILDVEEQIYNVTRDFGAVNPNQEE